MREINDPMPTKEESEKETKIRLKIIKKVKPELESFCVAVLLAGSVAYSKNFAVRKESDIDLVILINRADANKIKTCPLFTITPKIQEALNFFNNKEVDHFSILESIDNVKIQYHFWDKEAHYKAELLEGPDPKVYNIFSKETKQISGLDFSGKIHYLPLKEIKECKYGIIHIYPSHFIDNEALVLRQPILNLISVPDILFTKDKQLLKNIDTIWKNLTKRLVQESKGKVDLNKKSIIKSMYGHWNLSEESRKILEKRQKDELSNLGYKT